MDRWAGGWVGGGMKRIMDGRMGGWKDGGNCRQLCYFVTLSHSTFSDVRLAT